MKNPKMSRFERDIERNRQLREAEARGEIADGMEYRIALIARVTSGEISHKQAMKELAALKRKAKSEGRLILADFFKD